MPNPETHPYNFLQECYLNISVGGLFLEKLREESYCFKTYTEISLEKSPYGYFQVLFPFEGREGVTLFMWSYLCEWYLASKAAFLLQSV